MPDKINPYIAGAPVLESRMFFGREDVFTWIERSLSGKFVNHILVLHGQRRVGKTSVLKHLGNRLPECYIPIFIDLQGRVNTTLPRFLWWLAREITRALDLPKPDSEPFNEDPDYFESQFLPYVEEHLGDKVLLFTFDEFDTLESTSAQEGLALPFMAILKRLMEHKQLNFIFSIGSSGRKLENMQAAYTSFFKQALYRKISFLGESDARDLIIKPVEGILAFDLDAVDRIYEITSGHPYFIQLICHELFSVCQKSDEWHVSKPDVEAVLDAVIERGTVNLKFVWDEASELEKWVLASLAQFDADVDMQQLEAFLGKQKVRFIHQDLESAVLHLREKDVLASGNRFVIYLLKLWLIQNRSMEQVREELTRVNPIVSRLLQVGHEYLDQGELEKAIDSFHEALQSEEDNLEVRMGLASAYMAREDYGRAGAEYEEILALYPEDVAAQSGYCDAYLALGDVRFSMGRLDEAEYAYQQVLKISPKHSDGRARMAQLFHHRAVSAISGGKDVALEQARRALEFMPNDKNLQASVRELEALADGKQDIKDVLLTWGGRARQNERWQDAVDLLSSYQRLKGEGEDVLAVLDDLRKKARAQELDGLKIQALRLERLSQFDEAIFALNKYLSLEPDDASEIPTRIQALKEARKQAQLKEEQGISKHFWKQPLAWVGFAVVAVFTALLLIPDSPLWAVLTPPAPTQEIVERIVVATPVPTIAPTPTTAPLPYKWTRVTSAQFLERDYVTAIAIHPEDADIIFAGTRDSGMYKTNDGGISWLPIQDGLTQGNIHQIIIDPQDHNIIYSTTFSDGVFRSSNGGEKWEKIDFNDTFTPSWDDFSFLFINPENSMHIYYTNGSTLFESNDRGESWDIIEGPQKAESGTYQYIGIDPQSENLIVVAINKNEASGHYNVYFTDENRTDWNLVHEYSTGGPPSYTFMYFVLDPYQNLFYFGDQWDGFISQDGGKSWIPWDMPVRKFAISSNNLYVGISGGFHGINKSFNSSKTWSSYRISNTNNDANTISVSLSNPTRIAVAGDGIYITDDGGDTWSVRRQTLWDIIPYSK